MCKKYEVINFGKDITLKSTPPTFLWLFSVNQLVERSINKP